MIVARKMRFGFLLLALSLVPAAAVFASPATHGSNLQVVRKFYAEGNNPDKAASLFADDAVARMDPSQPPIKGAKAIGATLKGMTANGAKLTARIISSFEAGPVVVVKHIDSVTSPGEKPQVYKLVAVFVLKAGKISEWTEYGED